MAALTIEQALQMGLAHHQAGRLSEAAAIYREILAHEPRHANALHLLGLVALLRGKPEQAASLIHQALEISPSEPLFLANLGEIYCRLGRIDDAVASLQRALTLQPRSAEAHLNLGVAMLDAHRYDDAIASTHRALELRPDFAEAVNNLGRAFSATNRHKEALSCFERALALRPGYADAESNLAGSLIALGAYDEAIAALRRALASCPDHGQAHTTLGAAHWAKGEFEMARRCYERAIACHPQLAIAHCNLGALLLLTGHYEQGWRECEWRTQPSFSHHASRQSAQARWDGSPVVEARLWLHAEQGVGDAIQFLRYVSLARERAGASRLILEVPSSLTRLVAEGTEGGDTIVSEPASDSAAVPPFDLHLSLLSLPSTLGLFEPLTMTRPYLRPPPAAKQALRELIDPTGFRVGLVWAGNPLHQRDRYRSITFEQLRPLLQTPGIRFHSLQVDRRVPPDAPVIDLAPHIRDFADTAALISELDLVISVDTAVAHLAGALGQPVWTLLPFVPDWRWGLEREDTPWYPTMRLFRQRRAGHWDEVIERLAGELRSFVATSPVPLASYSIAQ